MLEVHFSNSPLLHFSEYIFGSCGGITECGVLIHGSFVQGSGLRDDRAGWEFLWEVRHCVGISLFVPGQGASEYWG